MGPQSSHGIDPSLVPKHPPCHHAMWISIPHFRSCKRSRTSALVRHLFAPDAQVQEEEDAEEETSHSVTQSTRKAAFLKAFLVFSSAAAEKQISTWKTAIERAFCVERAVAGPFAGWIGFQLLRLSESLHLGLLTYDLIHLIT